MVSYPHKNQIFLVGRHQEVRLFVLPGLHRITPVSSHLSRSEKHTFGSFLPSPATILCHQQVYWDRYPMAARKWWRGGGSTGVRWGDLMTPRDTPFS